MGCHEVHGGEDGCSGMAGNGAQCGAGEVSIRRSMGRIAESARHEEPDRPLERPRIWAAWKETNLTSEANFGKKAALGGLRVVLMW